MSVVEAKGLQIKQEEGGAVVGGMGAGLQTHYVLRTDVAKDSGCRAAHRAFRCSFYFIL